MALAAKYRQKKIAGLIGLAATADFGNSLYKSLSIKNKKDIRIKGYTNYKSYGFSYILTKKFFTEAKKNNILNKRIRFNKPVILIHGLKDNIVDKEMPNKLSNFFKSQNQQLFFLKSSDHQLSTSSDLTIINGAIDTIRKII